LDEGKKFDEARALLAHLKSAAICNRRRSQTAREGFGTNPEVRRSPEHERMRAQAEKEEAARNARSVENAPPKKLHPISAPSSSPKAASSA